MGGAAGHMAHPFDLPRVKNGADLFQFFEDAVEHLNSNPGAVKIDGVNVSFKLVDGRQGKEFAVDRGSLKPIDIEGITFNRIGERFPEGHGMREAISVLLGIFNEALPNIQEELEELDMWDNPTVFLNTEYVLRKTNVTEYDHNFLAIHGVNQFYEKTHFRTGASRPGAPRPEDEKAPSAELEYNPSVLKRLIKKVSPIAKEYNFKVYGTIPTKTVPGERVDFSNSLAQQFRVNFSPEDEVVTKSMEEWLAEADNPRYQFVKLTNGKKIKALSKLVYTEILNGTPITSFIADSNDVKPAIYGAVFYHATLILGDDILKTLTSDMGSLMNHEGVVLRDDQFGPKPVKITGKFILSGMDSSFREKEETGITVDVNDDDITNANSVALIPGKFKPPHRGHLDMVKHYSNIVGNNGKVVVLVSPISKSIPGGTDITAEDSIDIWNIYIKNAGLNNVEVLRSPKNSPVGATFDFVANENNKEEFAQPGDKIILGSSTKGGDQSRFAGDVQKYASEGVEILDPARFAFEPNPPELNATDFRNAIANSEDIVSWLPEESIKSADEILAVVGQQIEKKTLTMESLFSLVEQVITEKKERKLEGKAEEKHDFGGLRAQAKSTDHVGVSTSLTPMLEDGENFLDESAKDKLFSAVKNIKDILYGGAEEDEKIANLKTALGLKNYPVSAVLDMSEIILDASKYGRKNLGPNDRKAYDSWVFSMTGPARTTKNAPKTPSWEKTSFLEEEELEEMSSMAGGSVSGHMGRSNDKEEETLIREEL
tara:strand:- start:2239 stop:4548 length:2310 start_codon:yes stop_codon:yes gene_type:complete